MRREQIRKVEKPQSGTGGEAGCDNIHLDEKKLYGMLEQLNCQKYRGLEVKREDLLKETLAILRKALSGNDTAAQKEGLEASLDKIYRAKGKIAGEAVGRGHFR